MARSLKVVPDFTLYGYKGTVIEEYYNYNEEESDISFVALDDFTGCVFSDWKVTKESTYDEQGTEERTCLLCGKKETRKLSVLHPEYVTDGAFRFEIYTKLGYAAVTGYNDKYDSATDVTIPSEVNGYPVTHTLTAVFTDSKVKTVTIPASITNIDGSPFLGCIDLTEIKVAEGNERYYTVDGVLFDRKTSTLVAYPIGKKDKTYTVPDGTKVIGEEAFAIAANLEKVVLPESLKEIVGLAFYACINLKDVNFNYLTSVGDGAFMLTGFEELYIPKTLKLPEYGAFEYLMKLKSLTIEEGVEVIGAAEFAATAIETVTIPKSVRVVADSAFLLSYNLKEIKVADGNKNYISVDGVLYNKDMTKLVSYPMASPTTAYKVPDTVEFLEEIYAKNLESLIFSKNTGVRIGNRNFGYYFTPFELNTYDDLLKFEENMARSLKVVPDFTLYGYKGTVIEEYYNYNEEEGDISFVALDDFTGCVFSDWKVTKEPTIFESGEKVRACLLCGRTEEAPVDKLHSNVTSDSAYGVSLVYADGSFNGDIALGVNEVSSGNTFTVLDSQKGDKLKKLFDITPYINGQKAQPTKAVWVKIPLPSDFSAETTNAYYVSENGSLEKLDSFIEDGYIFFEVSHFSYYAIVDDGSSVATPTKCDCMCHKGGFSGFIYKIIRIFWRIFGTNKTCDCGAVHY